MNVPELPPFLLEPLAVDREREEFMKAMAGKSISEYDGQVEKTSFCFWDTSIPGNGNNCFCHKKLKH
jgi:hypothetical protein